MQEFKSPHSSNVAAARYNGATKTLEIDFQRGGTYIYQKFPRKLWDAFNAAVSKGTFVQQFIIKDRQKPRYKGVKKEQQQPEKDLKKLLKESLDDRKIRRS